MTDFVPANHTAAIEAAAEAIWGGIAAEGGCFVDIARRLTADALAAAWPHLAATIRAQIEAEQDVEWGVRNEHEVIELADSEADARYNLGIHCGLESRDAALMRRTIGATTPWGIQP